MSRRRRGARFEKYERKRSFGRLTKAFLSYLKGFVGLLIFTAIISIAYSATQLINPLILSNGIDQARTAQETTQLALLYGGIFIGLGGLGFLLQSISRRLLTKVQAEMLYDIRMDVYHRLINSSMGYLKKEQSGNVTARITGDTEQIGMGIQVVVNVGIQFMLLIATLILLIVRTGWQVTLITLGTIPLMVVLSMVFSKIGRKLVLGVREAFGKVSGIMAENISGIAVSKAFNREEEQAKEMRRLNEKHYQMNRKFGLMVNIAFPLIGMVASIAAGGILWVGGSLYNIDPQIMTPGEIFLGITLANQFLMPLVMLSFSFPQLQSALGAMDRVLDVMEATPAIEDKEEAVKLEQKDNSITFEDVWFAYEEDNWVIKDVSFHVPDGQIAALVGHTGAGKTTIASMLLTRFYDIQEGAIKIGEQDIREITQHSLRNTIGLIPQDPYLFNASVLENIRYGKPEATNEEVYEICKLIGADAFIEALPEGYETEVQEGGKKLSAGQRQMITIARTMLADPEILVLDEATSRLDTYSESLVQEAQEQLFKGRTTIVIAHRLSTIHNAQKILVFEHGELMEEGNHKELMEKDGIYADLYRTYYAFQGLEKIDLEKFVDEEEEVELSPWALFYEGKLTKEKIDELRAEGKLPPKLLEKIKQVEKERKKKKAPLQRDE